MVKLVLKSWQWYLFCHHADVSDVTSIKYLIDQVMKFLETCMNSGGKNRTALPQD